MTPESFYGNLYLLRTDKHNYAEANKLTYNTVKAQFNKFNKNYSFLNDKVYFLKKGAKCVVTGSANPKVCNCRSEHFCRGIHFSR